MRSLRNARRSHATPRPHARRGSRAGPGGTLVLIPSPAPPASRWFLVRAVACDLLRLRALLPEDTAIQEPKRVAEVPGASTGGRRQNGCDLTKQYERNKH